jgi:hypothetical protein
MDVRAARAARVDAKYHNAAWHYNLHNGEINMCVAIQLQQCSTEKQVQLDTR